MAEQTIPQFIEDEKYLGGIGATIPKIDSKRAAQRRRLFALQMDWYLAAAVGVLCAIGLLMVYSASIDASFLATEDRSTTYFFRRQLFPNLFVGVILMYGLARLDYRHLRRLSLVMMLTVITALVSVLLVGDERLEARRALINGSIQPGEAAKFVVVVYMAAWLASKRNKIRYITYGILPFSIMVGTVTVLIVLQPDISTAFSILATALTMFFLAGASWIQLGIVALGSTVGGWMLATQFEYARLRISSHLAAINDLSLANDHVQAAIVAFLDGGLFGVGLGEGTQKYAIPFPHTDSVFAVIGEELGLFGCSVVIALYVILVFRGFTVSRNAPDAFGSLLAAGVTIWLTYDALLNIAVMTALVPPTGVPLPFISFGGSSLITALAGVGLVLSVSRVSAQTEPTEKRRQVADVEIPEELPQEEKPRRRKPVTDEKVIEQARKARQQRRKEAVTMARKAREEEVVESLASTEELSAALADINVPNVKPVSQQPPVTVNADILTEPESDIAYSDQLDAVPQSDMTYHTDETPQLDMAHLTEDVENQVDDNQNEEGKPRDDDDSDHGGGNRRRRISRISCR